MIRNDIISYYIIVLFFPVLSVAGNITPVLNSIQPNSITIIGETHQHPESIKLFQNLIKGYLKNKNCLTVALEINSNQQTVIDQVVQGRAVVSDIEISSIIDHITLRNMITELINQQHNGACLNIVAIDAGDDVAIRRDAWMALKLADAVGNTPVLALLGGLHALKKVDWDLSMTKGTAYVAEILSKQGYRVSSYPQVWPKSKCNSGQQFNDRFISADTAEALVLLNQSFFSILNAFESKSTVVDGVIVWECET